MGLILGDPFHASSHERTEGYRRAFAEVGATIDEAIVVSGHFTYDVGYAAALDLCTRPAPASQPPPLG
ncbi:hypothetical protein [uncultured Sphingomonas sp.]|uniref:hypothetical protein n=1 Tax=uncultured Sphingomonas sp. TaxID=158754 RepID=UPI0025CCCC2A|nr:hypothetical protein [uncultured Sphingomonas sp.]